MLALSTIEESIDVEVPVRAAYNQWTQFEDFPNFMEGVESVQQLDDKRLHWVAEVAGLRREWDAEITEQRPDERIAWTSREGAKNAGVVTFHHLDPQRTRVMLQMEYEPEGVADKIGDTLGFLTRRVEGDLQRFKDFIESRGSETGAWRGEIEHGAVKKN
ncbi:MAG: SRPBCC family protein [Actinomycetota bacterium]